MTRKHYINDPRLYNTGRPRLMYRPPWLYNFCDFWFLAETADEQLGLLQQFSKYALKWLNNTQVKGNPEAERAALCMYRVMRRFAHFEHLQKPYGRLCRIIRLHRRLAGLVQQ